MKSMTRCARGHYYDSREHTACPHCGVQGLDVDIGKTMAKRPSSPDGDIAVTKPVRGGGAPAAEEGKTMSILSKRLGLEPVVGWLVAISGPELGRDYRITSDKNFIGRSESMEICIPGDDTISRDNHAAVTFNPKKCTFRLLPGEGKRLVYINEEEVDQPKQLSPYDIIELGETKLMFVPFCSEQFTWDKAGEK